MFIFAMFDAAVGLAHSAIAALATVWPPAVAIIVFTVAVRLALSPLTYVQVRADRRRAALAPQLAALRDRHRDDPLALAAETLAVQRAAGAGPVASLLPALAQAPFVLVLFRVVNDGLIGGHLFGVPLTAQISAGLPVFGVLLVLAAVLAWWSARRMRRSGSPLPGWLTLLPYLTVPAVAMLPLAGGLSLVTSTAWTALEQSVWRRPTRAGNR